MKGIILSFIAIIFINADLYGQKCCPYVGLISIKPAKPYIGDSIRIVTKATTPCLGNKVNKHYYLKNDTIYLEGCYYSGFATSPQLFLDTFNIGLLPLGIYVIHFTAYMSSRNDTCKPVDHRIGDTSFSVKTAGINSPNKSAFIEIFPNPTWGQQTIKIKIDKPQTLKIDLYNTTGHVVKTIYSGKALPGNQSFNLDLNNLSNGIYFYTISTGEHQLHSKIILR